MTEADWVILLIVVVAGAAQMWNEGKLNFWNLFIEPWLTIFSLFKRDN